jgi:hypothetical protein
MNCPICHEEITVDTGKVTLKCKHEMCVTCFTKWARKANTCPCCRDEFSTPPNKNQSNKKTMPSDIALSLLQQHKQQLNDYSQIRCMMMEKRQYMHDKVALMDAIIDYNVNTIARQIILWYES